MNEMDLKYLISQVVAEVLKKQQAETLPSQRIPEQKDKPERTVVIVADLVPFAQEAAVELQKRYGRSLMAVAFGAECRLNGIRTAAALDLGKEKTLNMIAQAEEVILLAPSLKVISALAQGRDDSLMEYLFLHAALWGKTTEIWMDFEAPQSRRLLPASPIADHVDALKNLGVKWFCYRKKQENKQEEKRILLTEEDVLQAYKAGNAEMVLEKGTMVTPLAKDATRRLGVKLKVQEVK